MLSGLGGAGASLERTGLTLLMPVIRKKSGF